VAGPHAGAYRAGLRSGDDVVAVNGTAVDGPEAWRRATAGARVGDTLTVDVLRDGRPLRVAVPLAGYTSLRVRVVPVAAPSAQQQAVRAAWMRGPTAP
jgi:S1-C subfamily serine protease